jgi:hypothetical protein
MKTAQELTELDFSNIKLPTSLLKGLLTGLRDNPSLLTSALSLKLRGNDFGAKARDLRSLMLT